MSDRLKEIGDRAGAAAFSAERALTAAAKAAGFGQLRGIDVKVLFCVVDGECTVGAICTVAGHAAAALNKLERLELVQRRKDLDDARLKLVAITRRGIDAARSIEKRLPPLPDENLSLLRRVALTIGSLRP